MPGKAIESAADPERIWELIARPANWRLWSPHVRGAEGLGEPEVQPGRQGKVILAGGLRVPARILSVDPGRSWSWKVGGLVIDHLVEPTSDGASLAMPVRSEGRFWSPFALAYAPVVDSIAQRIARLAEQPDPGRG